MVLSPDVFARGKCQKPGVQIPNKPEASNSKQGTFAQEKLLDLEIAYSAKAALAASAGWDLLRL